MVSPLSGPYQLGVELPDTSTLVIGHGSPSAEVSLLAVAGLTPVVQAETSGRSLADGVAVGFDTSASRMVKADVEIFCPGDDTAAGTWWRQLCAAFDAVRDVEALRHLWLWLPGIGHWELTGRPRGATDDGLVSIQHGFIEMSVMFESVTGDLGVEIVEEP